jgi:hypothetical protein
MTRLPDLPGHHRIQRELEEQRRPKEDERSTAKLMLIEAGYLLAVALAGMAALIGVIVFCGFVAVFGVMRKIWRALK